MDNIYVCYYPLYQVSHILSWLFCCILADERREQYASEKFQQPARVRMISRSNIFDHVMDLFSDESFLKEYPLHIKFEGEIAVDLGGVH